MCEKHRLGEAGDGGVLYADDLVFAGHVHTMGGPGAYRGWLVVEPMRHVPDLGDLTDDEAARIGWLANRSSRALKDVLGAEHVYAFVFGDGVPHLHVHLAPRYPDTPREYWGAELSRWPEAPRIDEPTMRRVVSLLRASLPG